MAAALRQFEFPVHVWSRTPKPLEGINAFAGLSQLPDFLKATRVLVNLLPLTAETQDILNRTHLSQLQKGAYVINVARGKHLVDQDLLDLLLLRQPFDINIILYLNQNRYQYKSSVRALASLASTKFGIQK